MITHAYGQRKRELTFRAELVPCNIIVLIRKSRSVVVAKYKMKTKFKNKYNMNFLGSPTKATHLV